MYITTISNNCLTCQLILGRDNLLLAWILIFGIWNFTEGYFAENLNIVVVL